MISLSPFSFGISIITVTLNQCNNLKGTIDSVQKFKNSNPNVQIEHVIIDGNSVDGTKQYIINQNIVPAIFLSESDNGIYEAMNKGVKLANFDYVVFINAGDTIKLKNLDTGLIKLLKNGLFEDILGGFAFSVIYKIGFLSRKITSRDVDSLSPQMPGIHQGMLYKRKCLFEIPFDENYKICGDYDQFARMFSTGYLFKPIDYTFSILYAGGISSIRPFKLYTESCSITNKYFKLGIIYSVKSKIKLILGLLSVQILLFYSRIVNKIDSINLQK
jgi:glycosyltransferase involved in cell wall biosynthesis